MRKNILLLVIIPLLALSCMADLPTPVFQAQGYSDGFFVSVSVPDFVFGNSSKSSIDTSNAFSWNADDRIGLFSNHKGTTTQTPSQLALTLSTGVGTSVAYSNANGWALVPDSTFNYFSYYPYNELNTRDQISIDYTGQVQTANNSTECLGAYDYMYSDMASATSESSASFSFHHIGSLVNVNITVPSGYEKTTFYRMRLCSDTQVFTINASYSVNDVVTSGSPVLNKKTSSEIVLSFGDTGIKPNNGVLNVWLMMSPTQWSGKTITLKLSEAKNNITTLSGTFIPEEPLVSGNRYSYSLSSAATGQYLPDKPAAGEQLHILLFGHSFGLDCTEYLPAITKAAGITDVHYGRWYQGNCSLASHWGHVVDKDTYAYYDSNPSSGGWGGSGSGNRKIDNVLASYPWDIILFQQSVGFGGNDYTQPGEGSYKTYQPHLNYLTHYVDSVCTKVHGKSPVIGWNMFWGHNEGHQIDYDRGTRGALKMYEAIVQAAKDMSADTTKATKIPLIIPVGTTIQNARGTSLNDPGSAEKPSTTQLLTRDGYHASLGISRYASACTWFQYLIAPIYGKTITGNSYRPTGASFEKDTVTDARAAIIWKCAIEAVKHPFEVTPIEE